MTKRAEVIYQSRGVEERAFAGVEKMLASAGILIGTKGLGAVFALMKEGVEMQTL